MLSTTSLPAVRCKHIEDLDVTLVSVPFGEPDDSCTRRRQAIWNALDDV